MISDTGQYYLRNSTKHQLTFICLNMKLLVTAGLLAFVASVHAASLLNTKAVDPSEVKFYHYSRDNIDTAEMMLIGNLNNANWKPWRPTKFIVHTFEEDGFLPWVLEMKLRMVTEADVNVIAIDWKDPAAGLYGNVIERVGPVGTIFGEFIDFLISEGTDLTNIHCVGYGVGAHVCGFAGKAQTRGKMGRITGLDPNYDGFSLDNPDARLNIDDALFVDIIHTSGGADSYREPVGHADFYPNNGEPSQPGCGIEALGFTECSHHRSTELFTESCISNGFVSIQCGSWGEYNDGACDANPSVLMGSRIDTAARGNYYLRTFGQFPFAQG